MYRARSKQIWLIRLKSNSIKLQRHYSISINPLHLARKSLLGVAAAVVSCRDEEQRGGFAKEGGGRRWRNQGGERRGADNDEHSLLTRSSSDTWLWGRGEGRGRGWTGGRGQVGPRVSHVRNPPANWRSHWSVRSGPCWHTPQLPHDLVLPLLAPLLQRVPINKQAFLSSPRWKNNNPKTANQAEKGYHKPGLSSATLRSQEMTNAL